MGYTGSQVIETTILQNKTKQKNFQPFFSPLPTFDVYTNLIPELPICTLFLLIAGDNVCLLAKRVGLYLL